MLLCTLKYFEKQKCIKGNSYIYIYIYIWHWEVSYFCQWNMSGFKRDELQISKWKRKVDICTDLWLWKEFLDNKNYQRDHGTFPRNKISYIY